MKKLYTFLIALLFVGGAMGQTDDPCETCLPDGIGFTTQSQIDSFPINYPNCAEILGGVYISGSDITNLNGLSVLTSIGGWTYIEDNAVLISLTGLDNLTSIGNRFYIEDNPALTSLTGLGNLTSIGNRFYIINNDALTSLTGLDNLNSIGWDLYIDDNDALTNLTGLENLTSIGIGWYDMGLIVQNNDALTELTGLNNVTSIEGAVSIRNNNALTSLTGLAGANSLTNLGIYDNDALTSLTGLDNLTSIGKLSVYNNDALTSLAGLEGISSLSLLYIYKNDALISLTELDNLTSTGILHIEENNALTSLTGLDNIDATSITQLRIMDNPLLSTCEVQSICDYLASPNGPVYIGPNAPGCNSIQEVEEACETVTTDELDYLLNATIYPNPSQTSITIELPTQPSKNTTLSISNTNGQQLITQPITGPQTEIDISHLPYGIYIVKVWNDEDVMVQKVIKQ